MTEFFADTSTKAVFNSANLHTFDDFWQLDVPLVDEPNRSKTGWSSVARIELTNEDNKPVNYYLKRQQNYFFKTPLHPLRGLLSLEKECLAANKLLQLGIACIEPAYFAKRKIKGDWQAILITKDISPLKEIDHYIKKADFSNDELIKMAQFVAKLHSHNLRHGALYSKHIFYHPDKGFAFIDLENVRPFLLRKNALKREFARLFKNSELFPKNRCEQFCDAYFAGKTPSYIKEIINKKS